MKLHKNNFEISLVVIQFVLPTVSEFLYLERFYVELKFLEHIQDSNGWSDAI